MKHEAAQKYFEGRRYKTRNHRTLYTRNLFVKPTSNVVFSKNSLDYVWKDITLDISTGPVVIPKGESLWQWLGNFQRSLGRTGKQSDWDLIQSIYGYWNGGHSPIQTLVTEFDKNPEFKQRFFPDDGFSVGYGQSMSPLVTIHPNGNQTIYGGTWCGYPSSTNPIQKYTQGLVLTPIKGKPMRMGAVIINSDYSLSSETRARCGICHNSGRVPSICTPMKGKDESYFDSRNRLRCKHGYNESHNDWTNVIKCWRCEGNPAKRGPQFVEGFQWKGSPIVINPQGIIVDRAFDTEATVRVSSRVEATPWKLEVIDKFKDLT